MPPAFRSSLALLASAVLLCGPALAFDTPLSDQAVREAYFLGQRRDESMYSFLNKYTKLLPPPKTGPRISAITFFTPFALLVQGFRMRSPEFWRAFKYRIFDGDEEITTDDLTGEPQFLCSEGSCILTGATVYIGFPANAFTADSATIEVAPREGEPVSVDFDLSSLR